MNDFVKTIMSIVSDVLGEDADGVYISDDAAFGNISTEEDEIFTSSMLNHQLVLESGNIDDFIHHHINGITYVTTCGMSKMVIVPEELNYVIKIPFTHYYYFDYSEGEENRRIVSNKVNYDILADEIDKYENCSDMVRQFLVPNTFVGLFNNCIPVYIQRKIETMGYKGKAHNCTDVEKKWIKFFNNRVYSSINIENFIPFLKEKGYSNTIAVLKEIWNSFSDLHGSNYGYINSELKIFDYGGYSSYDLWGE